VAEPRSPAERVLDLVFFGPAGLAVTAAEEFPKLAEKGRRRVEGQIRTARLVGQIAMQMGRRELAKRAEQFMARASTSPPRPAPAGRGAPPSGPARPRAERFAAPARPRAEPVPTPTVGANGQGPDTLAIPGYDSLSASQVVQRLAGLSHDELLDVRTHEQSHRHRRTILSRVEQLLADADGR